MGDLTIEQVFKDDLVVLLSMQIEFMVEGIVPIMIKLFDPESGEYIYL